MKYDIAMQLYANDIIEKEYYKMVNKVFSGMKIPQSSLLSGIDYKEDTTYSFSGMLGQTKHIGELEITSAKDYVEMKYEIFGLMFEISQSKDNDMGLHIRRELYAGPFGGKTLSYYMVDKEVEGDETVIRYYDGDACSLVRETIDTDHYEVEDFQRVGLLPDEEVVLKDVDITQLASSLLEPFITGKGNFEERITEIMHPAKQKVKE